MKYWVYFLIKNGTVIYIGHTSNLYSRLGNHATKQFDSFRSFECIDKASALFYEKRWINKFKPLQNKQCGRPPLPEQKVNVLPWLRQSVIDELKIIGKEQRRSISNLIEIAVEEKYVSRGS